MLVFFVLCFMIEIILATAFYDKSRFQTTSRYVAASAALMACFTILLMPFRKPSLPVVDISTVGQTPCSDLRSPEDNLRLWQFLTVSWMAPLISLGRKRQLNEPDVWFLGFEFQHSRLHEKFRRLRGSVLRRVLQANGLDVLIISVIAVVQMMCSFSTPVLLQQLLQAMQDPTKPKRVPLTYAVLALALRLVAAQSQVLNLWYGRRCYERSRGEMVMMVYEKALSRKTSSVYTLRANRSSQVEKSPPVAIPRFRRLKSCLPQSQPSGTVCSQDVNRNRRNLKRLPH